MWSLIPGTGEEKAGGSDSSVSGKGGIGDLDSCDLREEVAGS